MLNHRGRVAVIAAIAVASASAQQAPQFEVASVKVSPPFDVQKIMAGQQRLGMRIDAGRSSGAPADGRLIRALLVFIDD